MHHIGTVPLQTERLRLRRFELSDAQLAYSNWFSDPDVAMYMRWNAHKNVSETERLLSEYYISGYQNADFYRWAITLRGSAEVIGAVGFHIADEFDMLADVSYTLAKAYWGRGIAAEALVEVLRLGLLEVGLNRIEAFHAVSNPASGRVLQKAGMKYEGHCRQKYKSHKGFEDCDLYAILKSDLSGGR